MTDYVDDLIDTVRTAGERWRHVSDADASAQAGADHWSAKQVVGHLIDSASNNHQRFVRARWGDDLVFSGYDQDAWVSAQDYEHAPWSDLLDLWTAFNLHLARVMRSTPQDVRTRPHARHNLHELAWRPWPQGTPATLDYFMHDYVGHLRHHVRQIDAMGLAAPVLADES